MSARLMQAGGRIDTRSPVNWQHPLTAGLAGWWLALPNTAGGSRLANLTGRDPGTLTNGPTWAAGADGFAAVSFDGTNDVVTAPLAAAAVSGGYTFLVRCASTVAAGGTTNQWVLNYGAGNENVEILWGHVSLGYRGAFMMSGGGSYPKVNFLTLPAAGQWVTLGMSWNGSAISGYLDGVSQGTAACGAFGTPAAEALAVGAGNATGSGSQPWPGLIESVLAFRRPLSAADHAGWHRQFRAGLPDVLRRYTPRAWLSAPVSPPPPAGSFPAAVIGGGFGW